MDAVSARVLITVPWGERLGGAENMLMAYLRNLPSDAAERHCIAFLASGSFPAEVAALGLVTVVVPAGRLRQPMKFMRTVRRLGKAIDSHGADVLLNWTGKAQLYGGPAARLSGRRPRVVWWQHGAADGNVADRVAAMLPTHAVGCSSAFIAQRQSRLWPRRPTFFVHPGIEMVKPATAADVVRARVGVPPNRKVVGLVGRIQPWKRQDRLISAIAELRRCDLDVHAIIVGGDAHGLSPEYTREVRALPERLGVADRVSFTDQVSNPLDYIAACDVMVSAAAEPFGIAMLEAMGQGVPVIALAEGGAIEIIDPGRTGILIPDAEPRTIADEIARLLAEPRRAADLAEAALATVRDRFGSMRMTDGILAALSDAAERDERGPQHAAHRDR